MLKQARLRELVCYNPLSGTFIWRTALGRRAKVGGRAGYLRHTNSAKRSWCIRIHEHSYSAHRLAFLYMRGRWPNDQIDHKDRNRLNNRWLNLRECTQSQNMANQGPRKNNKLEVKGVHYLKSSKKYRAQIWKDGKPSHLGYFDTVEEAAVTYRKAAKKHFGKFASWD